MSRELYGGASRAPRPESKESTVGDRFAELTGMLDEMIRPPRAKGEPAQRTPEDKLLALVDGAATLAQKALAAALAPDGPFRTNRELERGLSAAVAAIDAVNATLRAQQQRGEDAAAEEAAPADSPEGDDVSSDSDDCLLRRGVLSDPSVTRRNTGASTGSEAGLGGKEEGEAPSEGTSGRSAKRTSFSTGYGRNELSSYGDDDLSDASSETGEPAAKPSPAWTSDENGRAGPGQTFSDMDADVPSAWGGASDAAESFAKQPPLSPPARCPAGTSPRAPSLARSLSSSTAGTSRSFIPVRSSQLPHFSQSAHFVDVNSRFGVTDAFESGILGKNSISAEAKVSVTVKIGDAPPSEADRAKTARKLRKMAAVLPLTAETVVLNGELAREAESPLTPASALSPGAYAAGRRSAFGSSVKTDGVRRKPFAKKAEVHLLRMFNPRTKLQQQQQQQLQQQQLQQQQQPPGAGGIKPLYPPRPSVEMRA